MDPILVTQLRSMKNQPRTSVKVLFLTCFSWNICCLKLKIINPFYKILQFQRRKKEKSNLWLSPFLVFIVASIKKSASLIKLWPEINMQHKKNALHIWEKKRGPNCAVLEVGSCRRHSSFSGIFLSWFHPWIATLSVRNRELLTSLCLSFSHGQFSSSE